MGGGNPLWARQRIKVPREMGLEPVAHSLRTCPLPMMSLGWMQGGSQGIGTALGREHGDRC
jgi:hypothetical protein